MEKTFKNILLVIAALILSAPYAFSQASLVTVSGVVSDENGEPLPGATVKVQGTSEGQVADLDGKYKIRVYSNQTLEFSFIGYKPQTYIARSNRTLNVGLQPDTKLLDEVVVVGYGTMKRSDLTGSVSSVGAKELENSKSVSVVDALRGMVAGVNITTTDGAPDAEFDIFVRGVGSVTGDTSPLFIVDGFEVSDISYLAKQDIKSIEVLKDASASAIYGARAANGVILVTTKDGHAGNAEISYNGSASYSILSSRLDMLTPYEFVDLQVELYDYMAEDKKNKNPYFREGNDSDGNPRRFQTLDDYIGVEGIDWQDEAFRPTWSQSHDVSIRGGVKTTQYLLSFSHYDKDGIFVNSSLAKDNARLKLKQQIFKWLTLNATVDYSSTRTTGVGTSGSVLGNILRYRPIGGYATSLYDLRHNTEDVEASIDEPIFNELVNISNTQHRKNTEKWSANGSLTVNFSRFLSLRTAGSFSVQSTRTDKFYNKGTQLADRGSGPYGSSDYNKTLRWTVTNQLSYKRTFQKKHKVDAILGQEMSFSSRSGFFGEAKKFPTDNLGSDNLSLGAVASSVTSHRAESRRLSFFMRGFYGYKDKYMITATVRGDASSVFSQKHKWGCFPSFSAAWNMSKEGWFESVAAVSNLKVRAGWGMVGNDRIANYLSLQLYNSTKYGTGSSQSTVLYPAHLPNAGLKWEAAMTTNVGVDLGLFNDRLNVTVDAFLKDSKDLLLAQDLTFVTGFASQQQNVGKLRNKGIELSVSSINFDKKNFSWTTNFNISFIRNKLVSLDSGKKYMLSRSKMGSSYAAYDYISEVGEPVGSMYGFVTDGVYQYSDFEVHADGTWHLKPGVTDISGYAGIKQENYPAKYPGHVKYKDIDGDGVITDNDRTVIGNGQPDFYGGITNSFYIYGVDVSFMFQFSYGNDIFNAQRLYLNQTDVGQKNMAGEVRNRWRPDNIDTDIPSAKNIIRYDKTSRYIEDGSFLRLQNLTIGYTLPQRWTRKIYVSKLRLYATAENLFCLTKYTGYDPEVNVSRSALMPGFDYGAYPKSKVFTAGVEINF